MKQLNKLFFCSFLLFITLAIGCPSVNKPYPERTYFLFEVSDPPKNVATVKGATLDINRFSISPSSEGREFIYRITDLEFRTDFYNQFFRPPTTIMTETVRQWINKTGLFEDVLNPVSLAIANYSIEGNIVELFGDYRNQDAAKAVLRIQLFLLKISEDGSDPQILLSKTYTSVKPIAIASPQNLMNGWNLALEDILNEFLVDLKDSVEAAELANNTKNNNS